MSHILILLILRFRDFLFKGRRLFFAFEILYLKLDTSVKINTSFDYMPSYPFNFLAPPTSFDFQSVKYFSTKGEGQL